MSGIVVGSHYVPIDPQVAAAADELGVYAYWQRVYDILNARYVYYTALLPHPTPLPLLTTPNHSGLVDLATHEIILVLSL